MANSDTIAFIQPFSLLDASGGARILRGLVKNAPINVLSFNTAPRLTFENLGQTEHQLPFRRYFGRIETTRLHWLPSIFDTLWMKYWLPKLMLLLGTQNVKHIHIVPHSSLDFAAAHICAQALSLPLSVSVHDHPRYCFRGAMGIANKLHWFGKIWASAQNRFVISQQMGDSLNREFGSQSFQVITDGVEGTPLPPRSRELGVLRVYFMGLFHNSYSANLECLIDALGLLAKSIPGHKSYLTLRCGTAPLIRLPDGVEIEILPFASEQQVKKDMEAPDLLYLPLPFGDAYRDFVDYSLSTKMVTYLGSGRPILYHGPENAAAGALLKDNHAAVLSCSMQSAEIADQLHVVLTESSIIDAIRFNALKLAREQFDLQTIHSRFWNTLMN